MNYSYENYDSITGGLLGGFTSLFMVLVIILLNVLMVGTIVLYKLYKK